MEPPLEIQEWTATFQRVHTELREQMARNWNRDLPATELLTDRWERARRLGFGEGSSIYDSSYVFGDVKVGRNTWIGPFTVLDGSGGLAIGDYCSIASGVQIYSHDSVLWALSGGTAECSRRPTIIGSRCYIGSQSVIAKGVSIGEQSVVAACSFVNRAVPARTVVGGTPARPIGTVIVNEDNSIRIAFERSDRDSTTDEMRLAG